jgi:putative spermidine/putrescine transport system permease protein
MLSERIWYFLLRIIVVLGFLFLIVPILIIIPISFNAGSSISYPLSGFSLQWYKVIFKPFPWMQALGNSLIIASITTILATTLGTIAAYGLNMVKFRGKSIIIGLMILPMVVPLIITGFAVYLAFAHYNLIHTFTGLILAHTALSVPFVLITVTATLQGFDHDMVRAAGSLGAHPIIAFVTVTMPLIAPGVMSGAIFAFVTSFDEIVVTLFLAGPNQFTLPRRMFSSLRDKLDPSIVAVATLLITLSVLLIIVVEVLRWRSHRTITGD